MEDAGTASPDAVCPRCDRPNRLAATYCGGCGAELPGARSCPLCGSPNPRRHRYCEMCGGAMFARSPRLAPYRAGVRRTSETASVAAPPGRSLPLRLSAGLRSTGAYVAVVVAVVATLPRFYQLDSVPAGLSAIERVFAAAASRVAHEGWIGLGSDAVAGEAPGFAYLLGAWSLLAGDSTVAMRLLPSSLGVATVGLFYLLTRRLLGVRPALFASLILALSFWHLQFSRLILPTILMLVAALAAANLLAAAIDEECNDVRRRALAAAAGLIVGLTPYIDSSFPILVPAVALFCLVQLAREGRHAGEIAGVLWLSAAAAALPYLFIAASDPGAALEQVTANSITAGQEYQDLQGITEQTRYLAASVAKTVVRVFFGAFGGETARLLDATTGLLALVGLLVAAARWRERGPMLLLALFVVGVALAGLTMDAGIYGRLVVAAPAALAAAGLGLHWITTWMEGRLPAPAIYGFAALLVALIAYMNLNAYFGAGPAVP